MKYINNKLSNLFDNLPDDVYLYIYKYISNTTLVWLNKNFYIKYHDDIILNFSINKFTLYIKYLIKNDLSFPFEQIFSTNILIFKNVILNNNKYYYNNEVFKTFFCFLKKIIIINNSNKCKDILFEKENIITFLKKNSRKRHKNFKIKNNKWSN